MFRLSHPRIGSLGKFGVPLPAGMGNAQQIQSRNKPYGGEVISAQFFYLDRFIMTVWRLLHHVMRKSVSGGQEFCVYVFI